MSYITSKEAITLLAQRTGLSEDQVYQFCQAQAELAFQFAESGFPIPGVGLLKMMSRPARKMVMRFGPKRGQTVEVPARRMLRLVVNRLASDVVLGQVSPVPDIRDFEMVEDDAVDDD